MTREKDRSGLISGFEQLHIVAETDKKHTHTPQAAQAHFMNADVTLACERCCVTNGYLQRFVWDANSFS